MSGNLKISLPMTSPGDGGALECCALLWGPTAPSRVGDSPSACPLPSPFPGKIPVVLSRCRQLGGHPSPTCGRGMSSPGKAGSRLGAVRGSLPGGSEP